MASKSEFKLGAILSYMSMVFSAIAGVLYTPWMIRCIGANDYGLYTLSLSLVNMFLLDFGLGQAVVRFLARYYAKGDEKSVPQFLGMVYKVYMLIALVLLLIYLAIFLSIDSIYASLEPSELATLKPLFIISAFYSVSLFPCMPLEGILTARERFVALNGCSLAWKVTTVLLTVGALLCGLGVYSLVLVNAIAGFLFALAKLLCVRKLTHDRADFSSWDGELGREILGFTTWQMVVQITENVTTTVTPSILAATTGSFAVTIIGLAIQVNGYVYQIASVVNKMLMASTARILESEEAKGKLQSRLELVGRFQLVSMGMIYVLFVCVGDRIIACWLGGGYEELRACILLVLIPTLLRMSQSIADTALMLQGHVRERGLLGALMLVCVVIVSFAASQKMGSIGAALGLCLGGLVRAIGLQVFSSNLLEVSSRDFLIATVGRWAAPVLITSAFGCMASRLIELQGWIPLLILATAVVAIYIVTCWILTFDRDDRNRVKSLIGLKPVLEENRNAG